MDALDGVSSLMLKAGNEKERSGHDEKSLGDKQGAGAVARAGDTRRSLFVGDKA